MIGRGYDPRDFALLAFGGGGPAARLRAGAGARRSGRWSSRSSRGRSPRSGSSAPTSATTTSGCSSGGAGSTDAGVAAELERLRDRVRLEIEQTGMVTQRIESVRDGRAALRAARTTRSSVELATWAGDGEPLARHRRALPRGARAALRLPPRRHAGRDRQRAACRQSRRLRPAGRRHGAGAGDERGAASVRRRLRRPAPGTRPVYERGALRRARRSTGPASIEEPGSTTYVPPAAAPGRRPTERSTSPSGR